MQTPTWTAVRARGDKPCDERYNGCSGIKKGEVYLREVFFPGDEVEEITVVRVCTHCANKRMDTFDHLYG